MDRPELKEDLYDVWDGFQFLSPSRPVGMDVGAIPVSEYLAYYHDLMGSRGEALERQVRLTRAVDVEFLAWNRERRKAD